METLPKDVLSEMALNLSPPDLISFCFTSKNQNKICYSDDFWRRKLERDYPSEFRLGLENPKEIYIKNFTYISTRLEKLQEKIIAKSFPYNFSKYLTVEYRKDLYHSLYLIYETVKNDEKNDEDFEESDVVEQLDDLIPEQILQDESDSLASQILSSIRKIVSNR